MLHTIQRATQLMCPPTLLEVDKFTCVSFLHALIERWLLILHSKKLEQTCLGATSNWSWDVHHTTFFGLDTRILSATLRTDGI